MSGEVCDQRDLLVGKGTDFLAVHDDCTDQFVLLRHRNGDKCPYTPKFHGGNGVWIAYFSVELFGCQVGDMDQRFGRDQATDRIFSTGTKGRTAAKFKKGRGRVVCCNEMQRLAIPAKYIAELTIANPGGILQHAGKHRLKVAG